MKGRLQRYFVVSILLLGILFLFPEGRAGAESNNDIISVELEGTYRYDEAFQVLEEVNKKRALAGADPLVMDSGLLQAAKTRASEIVVSFGHTRPDGTGYDTLMADSHMQTDENYGAGYSSAANAVSEWSRSSLALSNMTDRDYKATGIACFQQNGVCYWVQLFSGETADGVSKPQNQTERVTVDTLRSCMSFRIDGIGGRTLELGKSIQGRLVLVNQKATKYQAVPEASTVSFSSSDPSVLSVSQDGTITAEKQGTAVIYAFLNGYPFLKAEYVLTVGKKDLKDALMTLSEDSYIYDGQEKKPVITVVFEQKTLVEDMDYSVVWQNHKNQGTGTVTVTGLGEYTGTATKAFTILPLDISSLTPVLSQETYTYDGKSHCPEVLLSEGNTVLAQDVDYTVSYEGNQEPGQAVVIITGCGSCTGSITWNFTIKESGYAFNIDKKITKIYGSRPFLLTETYGKHVTYTVANTSIATVSKKGKVTVKGAGYTFISVKPKSADSSQKKTISRIMLLVKPGKPEIVNVRKKGKNTVYLKWKIQQEADGYHIEYSEDPHFSKKETLSIDRASVSETKIKGLKDQKIYYVRMCAYAETDDREQLDGGYSKQQVVAPGKTSVEKGKREPGN